MPGHENQKHAATVTGRRCRWCGWGAVTPDAVDAYAATAGGAEHDAAMREALVRRGITVANTNDRPDRCPSCESGEIVDYAWKLDDNGQVVPATTTPLKETG